MGDNFRSYSLGALVLAVILLKVEIRADVLERKNTNTNTNAKVEHSRQNKLTDLPFWAVTFLILLDGGVLRPAIESELELWFDCVIWLAGSIWVVCCLLDGAATPDVPWSGAGSSELPGDVIWRPDVRLESKVSWPMWRLVDRSVACWLLLFGPSFMRTHFHIPTQDETRNEITGFSNSPKSSRKAQRRKNEWKESFCISP